MVDTAVREAHQRLSVATCPEDVFGNPAAGSADIRAEIRKQYLALARLVHPDKHPDAVGAFRQLVEETARLLNHWWDLAQRKISQGIYGERSKKPLHPGNQGRVTTFAFKGHTYIVSRRLHSGGTCGVFEGTVSDRTGAAVPIILKVPHTADDNDLLAREAQAFKLMSEKERFLADQDGGEPIAKQFTLRLPIFLASIKLSEPGVSQRKAVNVFLRQPGYESGWHTLEDIRRRYPEGIETRVMVFIWNRILEGLTFAHAAGLAHGALTPNHVLIHAESHLGNIIDWTASCQWKKRQKLPYLDERFRAYFPPEVLTSLIPTPGSDLYMSAWCMVYLLGGDPQERTIPAAVEAPMCALLNRCLQPKSRARFHSADQLYRELRATAHSLFGQRKFVELVMS